MSEITVAPLDENTRRYYLDMMDVQCWQLLAPEHVAVEMPADNRDVALSAEDKLPDDRPDKRLDKRPNEQPADKQLDEPLDKAAAKSLEQSIGGHDKNTAQLSWLSLEKNIQQCYKCLLHKTRNQSMIGSGNQSATLMIILMSEDMDSEAGALLKKMLAAIKLSMDDVFIVSLLKCNVSAQHTVTPVEIQSCNGFLKQQIQLVQPEQLFILGETAVRCLFQKNTSLDGFREQINIETRSGAAFQAPLVCGSIPLLVSYSPQELLSGLENKRKSWSDLQLLQKILQGQK